MLVFDASRSMAAAAGDNTQLRRIDSARLALARIPPRLNSRRRLGLVTFGPRSRPACANANLDLLAHANAAATIMERVNNLKPDGSTPPTRAVRLTAEALDYRRRAVTIDVPADGMETCGGACCALARLLKASGARADVRVISYPIASAIGEDGNFASRCPADATAGLYVPANTEGELATALEAAPGCPVVPDTPPPLRAAGV